MRAASSVDLPVGIDTVLPWVSDLSRYVEWMPMVHAASPEGDDAGSLAWDVELRAKVGPFARSKRLRMVRTSERRSPGSASFVFERAERGGRSHSAWVMNVTVTSVGSMTTVAIDLEYGGSLWSAGVLDKVLAAQIEEGKKGILRVVTAPTR